MTGLPDAWRWATLNELQADEPAAITDGPFGSNLRSAHYTSEGPRVVRLQNIGVGVFNDAHAHIAPEHFAKLRRHEVAAGDLLIASLGEGLPRACLAPRTLGPAIVKADCIRVRLAESMEPRWVLYAMQTPALRAWAADQMHGVGRPRLGLKVIRALPVPLPPLVEQRRIVDVLEDHLSRLDAARDYLRASRRRLASLEAAILNGCVTGDRVALGELALHAGYGTSTKCVEGGPGAPVVRIPNLAAGRIDLASEKRAADPGADLRALMLEPDDLLIVRTNGSRALIGRTAVVQPGITAAFASYLIRYKLDPRRVRAPWASLMLSSPEVRATLEALAASSAGQYNLGLAKLNRVQIPVPALAAQDQLLAQVHKQHDATSRLAVHVQRAEAQGDCLRNALLAAAFSGRL